MSSPCPIILVVDDDPHVRILLERSLTVGDFSCVGVDNAAKGVSAIRSARPVAVIPGFNHPDAEATSIIRRVRGAFDGPVVIVSPDSREATKVACLDAGATDYVTKPFHSGEMHARIRAMLRRYRQDRQMRTGVEVAGLSVDLASGVATMDGERLPLTRNELRFLLLLSEQAGAAVPHATIISKLWGEDSRSSMQYLRVLVSNLRRKLGRPSEGGEYIETTPKIGYRIRVRTDAIPDHRHGFSGAEP